MHDRIRVQSDSFILRANNPERLMPKPTNANTARPGQALRQIRKERQWTLAEVSRKLRLLSLRPRAMQVRKPRPRS